jgi:hypothetical protein
LEPHELSLLRDACRAHDLADSLWPRALSDAEAATAWRLAIEEKRRLIVALRLPEETPEGQRRPQARPARGPYLVKDAGL